MNSFRNKLIIASVASAKGEGGGERGGHEQNLGLEALSSSCTCSFHRFPPQNVHLVPRTCHFRANPSPASQMLHLREGFWGGGFGFIPGGFSKASGSQQHLPPARRGGKKGIFFFSFFFFGVEKGSINSKM